jgi:hypothetical protein
MTIVEKHCQHVRDLQQVIDTIENDNKAIPGWLWKKIVSLQTNPVWHKAPKTIKPKLSVREEYANISGDELRRTCADVGIEHTKMSMEEAREALIKFFEECEKEERETTEQAQTNSENVIEAETDIQTLVNACRTAYEQLQVLSNLNTSIAIQTDSTRASLRNALSETTGQPGRELQEEVETEAYQQVKYLAKSNVLAERISNARLDKLQDLINTLENDDGNIPFGIWKQIVALKTKN